MILKSNKEKCIINNDESQLTKRIMKKDFNKI